ncbi:integrin alpha-9-like isoform X1 [Asterias rubens]|uniref:integrin alpha-9-like isoform X1 n=1 Tax=Asterias rubens TaxID=7604 RepID=UPI0014555570|nr:integrin alpha-9-like isoform X1 [Asterias rubens]
MVFKLTHGHSERIRQCVASTCPGAEDRLAPRSTRTVHAVSHRWRVALLLGVWWCVLGLTRAFNLDIDSPVQYQGPPGSYFGYSVVLHENFQGKWVLAGAPTDSSSYQPTLTRPGALYRCGVFPQPQTCRQIMIDNQGNEKSVTGTRPRFFDAKDNQWLGVSLARQNTGRSGRVVTCAHRWANAYFAESHQVIMPNGACFTLANDFEVLNKSIPCIHEVQIKSDANGRGVAWHGWCQAGFSVDYTEDGQTLLVGAVGSLAWRGSVVSIDSLNTMKMSDVTTWYPTGEEDESYIGYSVSSGHFISRITTQGVTGAPRAYQRGRVYIYDLTDFTLLTQLNGESMGTYFGAAVKGVDLNHDGLTDLLVGAPLFSDVEDEGRVYIYINDGNGIMRKLPEMLTGSNTVNARFGSVIVDAGDLNMDRYNDIAVGAPYEDGLAGAVYIYHGSMTGLKTTPAQRISGKSFSVPLVSFGSSISGGMDMDGNGYPDLVVGAHQSNKALLFLSKPVIRMLASIVVHSTPIDLNRTECLHQGKLVPCVRVEACFIYNGEALPQSIAINYTLEVDYFKAQTGLPGRLTLVENGIRRGGRIERTASLNVGILSCQEYEAHIYPNMKDFLSPLPFRMNFDIRTTENSVGPPLTSCTGFCPVLDMYSPNTIVEQVGFIYNCGEDSICETDLQLKGRIDLARGTPYIAYGNEENLYIHIDLTNHGEEAHLTQVIVTHPMDITFVRVESDQRSGGVVVCRPEKGLNRTSTVLCDVDNPMKAFRKRSFMVKLFIPSLTLEIQTVEIEVHAKTSSSEANSTLADNTLVMNLPVKIEGDVTISGVTHPEQVVFGETKSKKKVDGGSTSYEAGTDGIPLIPVRENLTSEADRQESIGPKFRHVYDARNLGPSTIPFLTTVNISLPWKTLDGDWLLYFTHIELQGTGRCEYNHILQHQHKELPEYRANTTSQENSAPAFYTSGESATYNCNNALCATIYCIIDNLRMGEGAVVQIQARFFEKTLADLGYSTIRLQGRAMVKVENHGNVHVQPRNGRPDSIVVETVAYTESSITSKTVPTWVIAVSTVAGIFFLIVVVLLLWKCGFFRRPMREEMQKLISDNDETESLNHEVDGGNYKEPFADDED